MRIRYEYTSFKEVWEMGPEHLFFFPIVVVIWVILNVFFSLKVDYETD